MRDALGTFRRLDRALAIAATVTACGCGGEASPSPAGAAPQTTSEEPTITDLRVPLPPEDPRFLAFASPEVVIQPGEDKTYCLHLRWDGDDTAFDNQETYQAKNGHHAVITSPLDPKPPGTVEDCSDEVTAARFDSFAISEPLPAGHAVFLPKGKPLALQFHYINAGRTPILVRDVVRLRTVPIESVTRWTAVFAASSLPAISIPPKASRTLTFDCTIPRDGEMLMVAGHMHESGRSIAIRLGRDAASLDTIYTIDDWRYEFRDAPPITRFVDAPLPVKKGDVLRTTCTWSNATDHAIDYPEEMCLSFGYLAGSKEAMNCTDGAVVAE